MANSMIKLETHSRQIPKDVILKEVSRLLFRGLALGLTQGEERMSLSFLLKDSFV